MTTGLAQKKAPPDVMASESEKGATRLGKISLEDAIAAGAAITGESKKSIEKFLRDGLVLQHKSIKQFLARREKSKGQ